MFQAKHDLLVQREHSETLFLWASKIIKYSLCYIGSFIEGQIQIKKSMTKYGKPPPHINIKLPLTSRLSLSFYATDNTNVLEVVPITHNDFIEGIMLE